MRRSQQSPSAARFLQARAGIAANQIGFWGQSQGRWIAPLAASRVSEAAFAIALSGGGLSPAEQELFDSEYELSKAGYTANEVNDALAFQKLKNEIIASPTSPTLPTSDAEWDQYAPARATAKEKSGFDTWDRCSGAGETRRSLLDSHAALLCLRSGANVARFKGSAAGDIWRA